MSTVYIIIVNWNGWRDTIECLESVFRNLHDKFCVVVCDNASTDGSLEKIEEWATGTLPAPVPSEPLSMLGSPPVSKPLPYTIYDRLDAERGGAAVDSPLVLVRCGANLGFAGANNVGLRYGLARGDLGHAWLLNNDTVVTPGALVALLERIAASSHIGMCGSLVRFYGEPDRVQAKGGGYYCRWIGLPWHHGRYWATRVDQEPSTAERWMNYVEGCSLLVTRRFLEEIGLMCEEYFLYFEEIDWSVRGKGRFALAYAPGSVIYHKVGRSIGTSSNPAMQSRTSDYYNLRNRIVFTRKFFPAVLPAIYLVLLGSLFVRLILGKWDRARMIVQLLTTRVK